MLSITKKIAIAASFMALCSGKLYASDLTEKDTLAKPTQADFPIDGMPEDVLKILIEKACTTNNPVHLTYVCKDWRRIISDKQHFEPIRLYDTVNPFLKNCMNVWWTERYTSGELKYKPESGNELILKFCELGNVFKGTFDLAKCEDLGTYLVITTDVERFFKIGGENQNKTVILIALRQRIEQEINAAAKPFEPIMKEWNAAKAPVGIFWRWGENTDASQFDYLTVASYSSISSRDLNDNWGKAVKNMGARNVALWLHVMFLMNQNKA